MAAYCAGLSLLSDALGDPARETATEAGNGGTGGRLSLYGE